MIKPYFVERQLQTWIGWNPYDRANPVRRSRGHGINFLENFQGFSFWKWDSYKELCQIIVFNQDKEEVGYIGYYSGGYCVSIYVDPKFRCLGLGSRLISLVPNLKVFQEDVGSFNKKLDKQDPLHSREYLLEWYSKKGVLR